jgi:hypothetical protein
MPGVAEMAQAFLVTATLVLPDLGIMLLLLNAMVGTDLPTLAATGGRDEIGIITENMLPYKGRLTVQLLYLFVFPSDVDSGYLEYLSVHALR